MKKLIKDLKLSDECYRVYDNGCLEILYLLSNVDEDNELGMNKMLFHTKYNQVYKFYQFGNENYIMNELDTIYVNKQDAIDNLKRIKNRVNESLEKLEE